MRKSFLSLAIGAAVGVALTGAVAADRSTRAQDRAAADDAAFEKMVAGLVPDKPVSCLPLTRQSLSVKGIGSRLVYRVNRKLLYVNDPTPGCEGVAREDIMVSQSPMGRACRGDVVQTLDRGSRVPIGGCALGEFTPYRAP